MEKPFKRTCYYSFGDDKFAVILIAAFFALFFAGCAGQTNLYTEVKPDFQGQSIKKIGIIKFKNQSSEPNAGVRVADIFYKELSSHRHFELVSPSEMSGKGNRMEFVKTPERIIGLPEEIHEPETSEEVIAVKQDDRDLMKKTELDAIVTGVISRYQDKDGSKIAVSKPASVAFKVYLISLKDNKILWSANFAETQQALLSNLLLADRYFQAGGVWLTSDELTQLGMRKILKTFPRLVSGKTKLVTE